MIFFNLLNNLYYLFQQWKRNKMKIKNFPESQQSEEVIKKLIKNIGTVDML